MKNLKTRENSSTFIMVVSGWKNTQNVGQITAEENGLKIYGFEKLK